MLPPPASVLPLADILRACVGAYSERTLKGYGSDLRTFVGWCLSKDRAWLPATPDALAEFVDDQVEKHCLSTIKRRLCAIAFAHCMSDLPTPTEHKAVRLAVRRAVRRKAARPKQVRGLTQAIRAEIVSACSPTLAGLRDAALISVGYDTLCRSSELAVMRVEHISFEGDATATVLIQKTWRPELAG